MKPLIPLTKQLDFMMSELQGPERRAGSAFAQPFGTAADAATAWDKLYERSGGAGDARARAYATDVFNAFRDDPTGGQNLPPNARFAMGYLTQKGMPLQNAAGIVGRLMTESYASMDPAARTTLGGGHGTYGVAQWRGPRLEALANFAGVPIEDIRNAPVSNGEGQYYPVKSEAPMAGLLGGPAPQQMPQQAESPWKTGQAWNTIALALNSLRNNPDQGLAQALQGRLQQGQDRAQANRTAAWLRSQGQGKLADALVQGIVTSRDIAPMIFGTGKEYNVVTGAELAKTYGIDTAAGGIDPSALYNVSGTGQVTKVGGSGTTVNVGGEGGPTTLQKKVDEKFAERYLDWKTSGAADTSQQVAQISSVLSQLEAGAPLTGPMQGAVNAVGLGAIFTPEAQDAKERVESVVQRSLRETLGAQFTEKEGQRLVERSYNPALPPEMNAARLRALYATLSAADQAKRAMIEYADQHGTLAGYTGPQIPSAAALEAAMDAAAPAPVVTDEQRQADLDALNAALGGN